MFELSEGAGEKNKGVGGCIGEKMEERSVIIKEECSFFYACIKALAVVIFSTEHFDSRL